MRSRLAVTLAVAMVAFVVGMLSGGTVTATPNRCPDGAYRTVDDHRFDPPATSFTVPDSPVAFLAVRDAAQDWKVYGDGSNMQGRTVTLDPAGVVVRICGWRTPPTTPPTTVPPTTTTTVPPTTTSPPSTTTSITPTTTTPPSSSSSTTTPPTSPTTVPTSTTEVPPSTSTTTTTDAPTLTTTTSIGTIPNPTTTVPTSTTPARRIPATGAALTFVLVLVAAGLVVAGGAAQLARRIR